LGAISTIGEFGCPGYKVVRQLAQSELCVAAIAAMNASGSNSAPVAPNASSGESNALEAASLTASLSEATLDAASHSPGHLGSVARLAGPVAGGAGYAVDSTMATSALRNKDVNGAAFIAADTYIISGLLDIPVWGPLAAGVYAIGGGSQTVVEAVHGALVQSAISAVRAASLMESCMRTAHQ
jgi:hypothetical protein